MRDFNRLLRLIPMALLSLAAPLGAQSFNLDVGDNLIIWPTPPDSYGAAASQNGYWEAVVTPYSMTLSDLGAGLTGVTVASNVPSSFNWPFGTLPADDSALMDDIQTISPFGPAAEWDFSGLQNGQYEVYTYAWSPENNGVQSQVEVTGSTGAQLVGGNWTGSRHVLGVTYARHSVLVASGQLQIVVTPISGNAASVNAIQLVQVGGPPWANYCISTPNSTGSPALISASGSASIGLNNLVLSASPLPDQPGIFFYGTSQAQLPFGNGYLCVISSIQRLPVGVASAGVLTHALDYDAPPTGAGLITAGSTWNFQAWFRDPAAGGANFDTSDALNIMFSL